MNRQRPSMRGRTGMAAAAVLCTAAAAAGLAPLTAASAAEATTTAWHDGAFQVDTPNTVRRSNIILGQPNTSPAQFIPLGNGTLGASVWGAGGFTAQLNRSDTFPDRKSPGQVVIPGLSRLTGASDFTGYLDIYDGVLHESGGGMTLTAYLRADTAQLVVDVTGADPSSTQTAQVKLWSGRSPVARVSENTAVLSETWTDNQAQGASGKTFGSLSAISAGGRNVKASTPDALTGQVAFNPNSDGSFRVVVAAPTWTGGDALDTAAATINGAANKSSTALTTAHLKWWHSYWDQAGLIKISSADGSGDYIENLRTLYLYDAAAERGTSSPGSQAGVADLFSFSQDRHQWFPAGYWLWNLRQQVQANLSAGVTSLNDPFFSLYRDNIDNIAAWTAERIPGSEGLCIPETMRFNGNGYYSGSEAASNASCDSIIAPSWNSQTFSSGAELALWIWQHYLATDDRAMLKANYPLISGAATFLLSVATTGSDGLLHTKANAHENQWSVTDPVTNIVAMQALFPVAIEAAETLDTDAALVTELKNAIPKIPALPRWDTATQRQLLSPSDDAVGTTMIGLSTQPTAPRHNTENLGLEAAWPYNLIGDDSSLTALAKRTYASRSYVNEADWTNDALQAARLGLGSDVKKALLASTKSYQVYPSGLASLNGGSMPEPYVEHAGVVAATVSEALVQDHDGLVRIAPAWPSDWSGEGTVYVRHNTKVHVQISAGTPSTVAIKSGAAQTLHVRNPWPGQSVRVVSDSTGTTVLSDTTDSKLSFSAEKSRSYLVERVSSPTTSQTYQPVSGSPASKAKHLGRAQIGLDHPVVYDSLAQSFNNDGITDDTDTGAGNYDGGGATFSAQALSAAGAVPGGTIKAGGLSFTWPTAAAESNDNTVADGQIISVSGSGTLGFLISGSYGAPTGTGTVTYTDGTRQDFTLTTADWWSTTPPAGGFVAVTSAYQNRPGNTRFNHTAAVFVQTIALTPGKTVSRVALPSLGALSAGTPALHVFAIATTT
ncbi:hypothetical protein [Streptomyces sp. NPDC005969]|uniref:glycosyl hydrolase family 95 catalytic domain-containing protein n=1 Tax=Streptomyces sp. NPDC005969 TaxID=3156722 RepID=UPI003405DEA7